MKVVVIVSTGNSGGGAIHDFLIIDTKLKNPFKDKEFRLLDDPDGILNLYYNFYKNCSINNPSNALMRFKNYINDLCRLKVKFKNKSVNVFNKRIFNETEKYIQKITILDYYALPQFIALQTNYFKKKYHHLKKNVFNLRQNSNFFKMYMPVKENDFKKETKKYLSKLVNLHLENKSSKYIILDQAVNIWNYAELFSYFDDVKVILVTRDPRGIYNSMKTRHSRAYPGDDLKNWTKWYQTLIEKFLNYKKSVNRKFSKNILEVKFEDFVQNYDKEQKRILKFLDLKKKSNNFQIEKSKLNAFKSNHELSNFEKRYIKKKLNKYLHW